LCQKHDDSPVSANGNGHTVAVAGHESVPHPIAIGIPPKETDRDDAVLEAVKDIDLPFVASATNATVWLRRGKGDMVAIGADDGVDAKQWLITLRISQLKSSPVNWVFINSTIFVVVNVVNRVFIDFPIPIIVLSGSKPYLCIQPIADLKNDSGAVSADGREAAISVKW
jgi:hypothetical protein